MTTTLPVPPTPPHPTPPTTNTSQTLVHQPFTENMISKIHVVDSINSPYFTGDESKQITWENLGKQHGLGKLIKVTDSKSALRAIAEITKEGEGSSRCNPFYFYNGTQDLSHYNLFKCITEKHEMQVYLKDDFPEDVQEQNSSVYFIPVRKNSFLHQFHEYQW